MNVSIPDVRVGEPTVCGGLFVFPLFGGNANRLDYLLSEEAILLGMVVVREVSAAGSVNELLVDNGGDKPVLFLEGQGFKGAKQDRVVRSSVLVAGRSQTRIPVSCVEKGRWWYESRKFKPGSCCPPSLRHLLKSGSPGGGTNQSQMWAEIQQRHRRLGVQSRSANLSDALDTHRGAVEDLQHRFSCPEGASGIAVALDGKFACTDLLDKPETLARIWHRLVQGISLDALEVRDSEPQPCATSISARLYRLREKRWERINSVGMGEAYRAQNDEGELATALVVDGTLLHLSVSVAN